MAVFLVTRWTGNQLFLNKNGPRHSERQLDPDLVLVELYEASLNKNFRCSRWPIMWPVGQPHSFFSSFFFSFIFGKKISMFEKNPPNATILLETDFFLVWPEYQPTSGHRKCG